MKLIKEKLIDTYQEYSIECDNTECDYKILSPTGDINEDISGYINVPCPKCGENLLTPHDYLLSLKIVNTVNYLNKWFSWLTIFFPKNLKRQKTTVSTHKEIMFKNEG